MWIAGFKKNVVDYEDNSPRKKHKIPKWCCWAAKSSGVFPNMKPVFRFFSTLPSIKVLQTAKCPSSAAIWSGVQSILSAGFLSTCIGSQVRLCTPLIVLS